MIKSRSWEDKSDRYKGRMNTQHNEQNYYHQPMILTGERGNNAFSFEQRKKNESLCQLTIPSMITGTIDDVQLSDQIVFEERDEENNQIVSYAWLKYLVHIPLTIGWTHKDIYIIDNHNHALYCRWKSVQQWTIEWGVECTHIDQHSDLAEPAMYYDEFRRDAYSRPPLSDLAVYTNEILQVGNFIKPALSVWLLTDQHQVRTEYSLLQWVQPAPILDIDLDFRAPEMSIADMAWTIQAVRDLMVHPEVKCITIATSPYFIDQQLALKLFHQLLADEYAY